MSCTLSRDLAHLRLFCDPLVSALAFREACQARSVLDRSIIVGAGLASHWLGSALIAEVGTRAICNALAIAS